MTTIGRRLHAFASTVCDADTLALVVEPALADLQLEVGAARTAGRAWSARLLRIRGTLVCALLILRVAAHGLAPDRWTPDERRTCWRLLRVLAAGVAGGAVIFVLMAPGAFSSPHASAVRLLALFLPCTLPITLPGALAAAVLLTMPPGRRGRRVRAGVVMLTCAAAVGSFVLLAWVIPATNMAYRHAAAGQPVEAGVGEMTLADLRRQADGRAAVAGDGVPARQRRFYTLIFHARVASVAAVPVMVGLALTLAGLTTRRRLAAALVCTGHAVWHLLLLQPVGMETPLSPLLVAWLPHLVLAAWCVARAFGGGRDVPAPMAEA